DWSGIYVGAVAGVGSIHSGYVPNGGGDPQLNGSGFVGGGMIGYNYQMGSFVVGAETDIMGTGIDPAHTDQGGNKDKVDQDIDYLTTLRARIGWVPNERTLLYGTVGVGWLRSTIKISNNPPPPGVPLPPGLTQSKTHFGYILGAGMEHAITNNITARIEYLYGNFNQKTYTYSTGDTVRTGIDNLHVVRGGFAYKF
ncbi:MAG TPA: porin family protein, partial [Rhizobiales bacterium]|nr:porin family protein [Hyphomicrobiales bacterium]